MESARSTWRINKSRQPSLIDWLGKLFFRRLAPWQRRQKLRAIGWALVGGLVMGVIVVGVILMQHFHE